MDESPCENFTASKVGIEKVSRLVLPMEMELTIDGQQGVILHFATQTPTKEGSQFTVGKCYFKKV